MGRMLGFDFPRTNYPISLGHHEFWRRWHMTAVRLVPGICAYIPRQQPQEDLKRRINANLFVVGYSPASGTAPNWNYIWELYYFVLRSSASPLFLKGQVSYIYTSSSVVVGWAMFVGNDAGVGQRCPQAFHPFRQRDAFTSCATTAYCWRSPSSAAPRSSKSCGRLLSTQCHHQRALTILGAADGLDSFVVAAPTARSVFQLLRGSVDDEPNS